jgi:hypothetical protein
MVEEGALEITRIVDETGASYSLTFDPRTIPPLAKVFVGLGREPNGHAAEAILVRLSEIGTPSWGDELVFDSETDCCVVSCRRKAPLVHLLRRLEKRLAEPARLRRLANAVTDT